MMAAGGPLCLVRDCLTTLLCIWNQYSGIEKKIFFSLSYKKSNSSHLHPLTGPGNMAPGRRALPWFVRTIPTD